MVLVDGEKEYESFSNFIYDGEFSFNHNNDLYLNIYDLTAGDTRIEGMIYAWDCKNMTSEYLSNFLKNIVLKDDDDNINTVTGYANGRFDYDGYHFDVMLSSPLSAGDYTITYPGGRRNYFTVIDPSVKTPVIYGVDAGEGFVNGRYLPTDAVYTAKIYQGYNCITNDPFTLTLSGEYTSNTVQYLYIPKYILSSLDAGSYELRIYLNGVLLRSVTLTISARPQQTVVAAYDPFNNSNVLLSTSGYVSFRVSDAIKYKQFRFSEDLDELSSMVYSEFLNAAYVLSPGDGEKNLYVQLRDYDGNESDIFHLKIYRLVETSPALYVHENQQGVYAGNYVTLLLGADTQYLDAYVEFFNAEGIWLATAQLNYRGLGKVTAFGNSEGMVIESDHPYSNESDQTWVYTLEGSPSSIYVTFSNDTYVEENFDYLYVYDGSDNLIGQYTGAQLANQTLIIPGDTVKVRLTSDSSITGYGFRIVSVVDSLENSGDSEELKYIFSSTISTTGWNEYMEWNEDYFDSLGIVRSLKDTMLVRFYLGTGNINNKTVLSKVIERFLVFGSLNSIVMPQFSSSNQYSTNESNVALRGFATPNSTVYLNAADNQGQGFTAEVQADQYGYFTYTAEDIGEGIYTFTATDDQGLSLAGIYKIIIDRTPPTIEWLRFSYIDNQNVAVQWACYDTDVAEFRLYVNDIRVVTITYPYGQEYNRNVMAQYGDSFRLVAVDNTGNERVVTREIGDEEPPTTPGTPVMDYHGTKSISFSWEASTDNMAVHEYDIYRNGELIDTVGYETTSYIDTGLDEGKEYLYEIYARDKAGNVSEGSPALLKTAVLTINSSSSFEPEYIKEEQPHGIYVWIEIDDSDPYYNARQSTGKFQYKLTTEEDWNEIVLPGTGATKSGIWIIEDLTVGTYQVRFAVIDPDGTEKTTDVSKVDIEHDMIPPDVSISKPSQDDTLSGKNLIIKGNSSDNFEVDKILLSYSTDEGVTFNDITTLINENISYRKTFAWEYTFDASSLPSGNVIIKAVAVDGRGNSRQMKLLLPELTMLPVHTITPIISLQYQAKAS